MIIRSFEFKISNKKSNPSDHVFLFIPLISRVICFSVYSNYVRSLLELCHHGGLCDMFTRGPVRLELGIRIGSRWISSLLREGEIQVKGVPPSCLEIVRRSIDCTASISEPSSNNHEEFALSIESTRWRDNYPTRH